MTGLASFGVFVSLDDPFVDGLLKLETLDDWFDFDARAHRMVAGRTGRTVSLGDRLRVRVTRTNVGRGQIDLELVEWSDGTRPAGRRGVRQGGDSRPTPGWRRYRRGRRRGG